MRYAGRIRAVLASILVLALAGTAAADTLGQLTFSPPDGWEEQSAKSFRVTYTRGKAYIAISVGELSTLDLPADTSSKALALHYELDGKVTSEGDTEVAGAPGYAMLYQAGDGVALITATSGGGGTVFQLETTRATMDDDLAAFAKLVDHAALPAAVIAKVPHAEPASAPTVIDRAQLARLPDERARKLADALAAAVVADDRKKFLSLAPKKGLAIGRTRYKRAKLAKALTEGGIGALLGWDPEAPFAVVVDRKKKTFGVYRGTGSGVTAIVMFKKKGKSWAMTGVVVRDFGEPSP